MNSLRLAGEIEYLETGAGPTVVLAPGSCSTGAAWRPVIAHLLNVRAVTTSLSGYGGTAERHTANDRSIMPVAEALEDVIRRADAPVHLVGHSFGGLAAVAVALRDRVSILSLTVFEAPAPGALTKVADQPCLAAFHAMTDAYSAAHEAGDPEAIGAMIDFYGGTGSWAQMPEQVRAYAAATTSVNIIDWEGAYGFTLDDTLRHLSGIPVCVAVGERSHPAVVRANALIAERIKGARFVTVPGAAHFMTATHPQATARLIIEQVQSQSSQAKRGYPDIQEAVARTAWAAKRITSEQ